MAYKSYANIQRHFSNGEKQEMFSLQVSVMHMSAALHVRMFSWNRETKDRCHGYWLFN